MFGSFLIWGARERPFSSGLSAWELTPPIPQPQMRRIGVKIYTKVYLIVWFFHRFHHPVFDIGYRYNITETSPESGESGVQTNGKCCCKTKTLSGHRWRSLGHFFRHFLMEICANNSSFPEKINVNASLMIIQAVSSARKNFPLPYKPVMRQSLDIFMYFRHVIWVGWPSSWFRIIFMISFLIKFLQMVIFNSLPIHQGANFDLITV